METCNRDCFNCEYEDCINPKISQAETLEIQRRDILYYQSAVIHRGRILKKKRLNNH